MSFFRASQVKSGMRYTVVALLAALTLGHTTQVLSASEDPVQERHVSGVVAPSSLGPFTRAVSLAPHVTELLYAAGAGDYLVATVAASDFPESAQSLPRVGTGITLDNEHLISLKPDIVLAWQPSAAAIALSPSLQSLNITQAYSAPQRLADIPSEIRRFGRLFQTEHVAIASAEVLERRIQDLDKRYRHAKTISVFIEVGSEPLYTIGGDTLINDVLATCGIHNVYGRRLAGAPQVNAEALLIKNPTMVLLTLRDPVEIESRQRYWQGLHLPAALSQRVYNIDPDILYRPGPRLVDAATQLCHIAEALR